MTTQKTKRPRKRTSAPRTQWKGHTTNDDGLQSRKVTFRTRGAAQDWLREQGFAEDLCDAWERSDGTHAELRGRTVEIVEVAS